MTKIIITTTDCLICVGDSECIVVTTVYQKNWGSVKPFFYIYKFVPFFAVVIMMNNLGFPKFFLYGLANLPD